jgi:hypothetical protein
VEGFAMDSKFAIGDKVDQAFSNHAEGTVIAIFTDLAGEHRYAVEMFGHRAIQIASEGSLSKRFTCASEVDDEKGVLARLGIQK